MSQTNNQAKANQNQQSQAQAKAEAKKQAEAVNQFLNDNYGRYATLKFIEFDGGKLKEAIKKELTELEKTIMKSDNPKAKKTVPAAIGTHILKLVEGVPVPDAYIEIIKDNDAMKIYCG